MGLEKLLVSLVSDTKSFPCKGVCLAPWCLGPNRGLHIALTCPLTAVVLVANCDVVSSRVHVLQAVVDVRSPAVMQVVHMACGLHALPLSACRKDWMRTQADMVVASDDLLPAFQALPGSHHATVGVLDVAACNIFLYVTITVCSTRTLPVQRSHHTVPSCAISLPTSSNAELLSRWS